MSRYKKETKVTMPAIRCAVYTRKSTEEGLEQDYNTLDAQRDAGEAYIRSQQHEGWVCLPEHYDDGGFTGANMERPALRRLLADIDAGRLDCVVVYKVDRLSRSLLDFARIMEAFDRRRVSFVSVTQAFNTASSMGRLVNKKSLYDLLTNVAYIGKVGYKEEVHDGEQTPIVEGRVFTAAQTLLKRNGRSGGRATRTKHSALLRGRLRCATCDCAMSHSFTVRGPRRYRYYVCQRAQKHGWDACPNPSIPAGEVERFVVDEIKRVGRDSRVVLETLMRARGENEERTDRLKTERAGLTRRLRESSIATEGGADASSGDRRLAESPERLRDAARRMVEIDGELTRLAGEMADETDVAAALADFDDLWASLAPREQLRVVELLVEQVVYNGPAGTVAITFRPNGIRTLAGGMTATEEEAA